MTAALWAMRCAQQAIGPGRSPKPIMMPMRAANMTATTLRRCARARKRRRKEREEDQAA
jgi:hypothetical protein